MRPRRLECRLPPEEYAQLEANAARFGRSLADIVRAQLAPFTRGSLTLVERFNELREEGLLQEKAGHERTVERLDAIIHQMEPGSSVRGILQSIRDEEQASLRAVEKKILALRKVDP